MEPHVADLARRCGVAYEKPRTRLESLLGKIGFEVDDDLAAISMRPRDASDQKRIVLRPAAMIIRHP